MFNNLKRMLGEQETQDEINPELEDMYQQSFDDDSINLEELMAGPELSLEGGQSEEILNDPNASYELKKQAMQKIKDRYLKPRDE